MKDELITTGTTGLSENFASSAQRVLTIDVERYDQYMRDTGMNAEQKEEFLRAMFSIVMTFVELGFGVHPLQQVDGQEPCGQVEKCSDQGAKDALDRVRSKVSPKTEPKNRTGPEGRLEAE